MTNSRLLLAASLWLLPAIARAQFTPAPGSPFPVGMFPESVAVGDFNGDGILDLALTNAIGIGSPLPYPAGTVTVLLGDGKGGFTAAPNSPFVVGSIPAAIVVADFNGDGNLDLATANFWDGTVTVLLGDGRGGFSATPGGPSPVGFDPDGAAVGDFNGDGTPDLAVVNYDDSTVTVLLGDGTGGFTAAANSPFPAGAYPSSVAVGDFNLDGNQDLAIADRLGYTLTVLLGDGTGGFTAALGSPFPAGSLPQSVAVADFNRDGNPDVAIANNFTTGVTVLLGNGTGGFTPAPGSPFAVGTSPQSVWVADFNRDGNPDLAIANEGDNTVTVLLGNGGGGLSAAPGSPFPTGMAPYAVTVGDFNGDGKPDLAIANRSDNTVTVLLNTAQALPDAILNEPYSASIGNYSCSLATGAPPPGLSITVVSGVCTVSGTATELGSYQFTINYIGGQAEFQITVESSGGPGSVFQVNPSASATSLDTTAAPVMQTITVTNTSSEGPSVNFNASITGPPVAGYEMGPSSGSLSPGEKMVLTITFDPSGALVPPGFYTGTYTVTEAPSSGVRRKPSANLSGNHALHTNLDHARPRTSNGGGSNSGTMLNTVDAVLQANVTQLDITVIPGLPQPQPFLVSDAANFNVNVSASYTDAIAGAGAVTLGSSSGNTPITMSATATSAGPAPGPNSGMITVNCVTVNCDSLMIPVELALPSPYTISGQVNVMESSLILALSGVTMTLSGTESGTATTDGSGGYTLPVLGGGNYTVTPSLIGYTFSPASLSFTGLSGNESNANFVATAVNFTISGQVALSGSGLAGVGMTLSGSQSGTTTTNSSGNYSFSVPAGGSYTVTPSLAGYSFTPPGSTFNNVTSNVTGNFAASPATYTISGQVALSGSGLAGVGMTLSGSQSGTTTTNSSGNYSFSVPAGGSYTVTPSLAGYSFNPASLSFSNLSGNQTSANFTASTIAYTISGQVTFSGSGLSGVGMTLSGSQSGATTTNSSGTYSFTVPAGGSYTVTPLLAPYSFNPSSLSFKSVTGNQTGANFTASTVSYTISGQVTLAGVGLSGVELMLSGSQSGAASTTGAGSYSFTVAAGGSYTVTPSLAGYIFNPSSQSFTGLSGNQTANFTANPVSVTHTLSGQVSLSGSGLSGVTMKVSGSQSGSVTTNSSGSYTFTLAAGGSYTVTPSLAGYSFSPSSAQFTDLTANQTANFAAQCGYTVSPLAPYLDATSQAGPLVSVTAGAACHWTAFGDGFATVTSGASGTGNGSVFFNVPANTTGAVRTATLTVAGQTVTVTQRTTAEIFADVTPPAYYFDFSDIMDQAGITAGCSTVPLDYCPNSTTTRGEMAVFLIVAIEGGNSFTYTPTPYFTDVPASSPFFKFIQKLRDLGITSGCTATTYCPNDSVTRGEMAVFIIASRYGSTKYTYPSTPYFTDVPPSNPFFPFIQKMAQTGITSGCAPELYCPDETLTRGQMAVFIVTGLLNELLPAGTAVIASAAPNTASPGQTVTVTVSGVNTHFAQGTTQVMAASGMTTSDITVLSGTSLRVQLTVGASVAPGPTTLLATTGTEEAVLPNGFVIQ